MKGVLTFLREFNKRKKLDPLGGGFEEGKGCPLRTLIGFSTVVFLWLLGPTTGALRFVNSVSTTWRSVIRTIARCLVVNKKRNTRQKSASGEKFRFSDSVG